jgi:hypothetical protein
MFMAHENCPFSGKMIQASGGAASGAFFAAAAGIAPGPDLTLESVQDAMARITDRETASSLVDPDGALPPLSCPILRARLSKGVPVTD